MSKDMQPLLSDDGFSDDQPHNSEIPIEEKRIPDLEKANINKPVAIGALALLGLTLGVGVLAGKELNSGSSKKITKTVTVAEGTPPTLSAAQIRIRDNRLKHTVVFSNVSPQAVTQPIFRDNNCGSFILSSDVNCYDPSVSLNAHPDARRLTARRSAVYLVNSNVTCGTVREAVSTYIIDDTTVPNHNQYSLVSQNIAPLLETFDTLHNIRKVTFDRPIVSSEKPLTSAVADHQIKMAAPIVCERLNMPKPDHISTPNINTYVRRMDFLSKLRSMESPVASNRKTPDLHLGGLYGYLLSALAGGLAGSALTLRLIGIGSGSNKKTKDSYHENNETDTRV